jgi:hypothetical protein
MKIFSIKWKRVYSKAKRYKLFEISDNKALGNILVFLSVRKNQFNAQFMILKSTDDGLLDTIASFK